MVDQQQIPVRLRYGYKEAAALLGIGVSSLYEKIAEGKIAVVKDGGRRFIHRDELDRYSRGEG